VEPINNEAESAFRAHCHEMMISQQSRSELHKESYAMQASLYMTSKLRGQNYIDVPRNVVEGRLHEGGKVDSYYIISIFIY